MIQPKSMLTKLINILPDTRTERTTFGEAVMEKKFENNNEIIRLTYPIGRPYIRGNAYVEITACKEKASIQRVVSVKNTNYETLIEVEKTEFTRDKDDFYESNVHNIAFILRNLEILKEHEMEKVTGSNPPIKVIFEKVIHDELNQLTYNQFKDKSFDLYYFNFKDISRGFWEERNEKIVSALEKYLYSTCCFTKNIENSLKATLYNFELYKQSEKDIE